MMRSVVYKDHSGGGWLGEGKTEGQEPDWEMAGTVQVRTAVTGN